MSLSDNRVCVCILFQLVTTEYFEFWPWVTFLKFLCRLSKFWIYTGYCGWAVIRTMGFVLFLGKVFLFYVRRQLDWTQTPESIFYEVGSSWSLLSPFNPPAGVFYYTLWSSPYTYTVEGPAKDWVEFTCRLEFSFCGSLLLWADPLISSWFWNAALNLMIWPL